MKKAIWAALACVGVVAAGCSSDGGAPAAETPSTVTGASTGSTPTEPALVGRWERVNECQQLVDAFKDAGLEKIASSYVGDFFPDADPTELARKDDLCEGAAPLTHSHFFTEDAAFGSLTESLEQVDDGTYETDGRMVLISKEFGKVLFHYNVDGNELTLSPVLTRAMEQDAVAHPLDFSAAGWALTMSYPGQTWTRVDCSGWC